MQNARDKVLKRVIATEDLGAGQARRRQVRLEGLDETSGAVALAMRLKVVLDGLGSGA